jgi:hypothetical protein
VENAGPAMGTCMTRSSTDRICERTGKGETGDGRERTMFVERTRSGQKASWGPRRSFSREILRVEMRAWECCATLNKYRVSGLGGQGDMARRDRMSEPIEEDGDGERVADEVRFWSVVIRGQSVGLSYVSNRAEKSTLLYMCVHDQVEVVVTRRSNVLASSGVYTPREVIKCVKKM